MRLTIIFFTVTITVWASAQQELPGQVGSGLSDTDGNGEIKSSDRGFGDSGSFRRNKAVMDHKIIKNHKLKSKHSYKNHFQARRRNRYGRENHRGSGNWGKNHGVNVVNNTVVNNIENNNGNNLGPGEITNTVVNNISSNVGNSDGINYSSNSVSSKDRSAGGDPHAYNLVKSNVSSTAGSNGKNKYAPNSINNTVVHANPTRNRTLVENTVLNNINNNVEGSDGNHQLSSNLVNNKVLNHNNNTVKSDSNAVNITVPRDSNNSAKNTIAEKTVPEDSKDGKAKINPVVKTVSDDSKDGNADDTLVDKNKDGNTDKNNTVLSNPTKIVNITVNKTVPDVSKERNNTILSSTNNTVDTAVNRSVSSELKDELSEFNLLNSTVRCNNNTVENGNSSLVIKAVPSDINKNVSDVSSLSNSTVGNGNTNVGNDTSTVTVSDNSTVKPISNNGTSVDSSSNSTNSTIVNPKNTTEIATENSQNNVTVANTNNTVSKAIDLKNEAVLVTVDSTDRTGSKTIDAIIIGTGNANPAVSTVNTPGTSVNIIKPNTATTTLLLQNAILDTISNHRTTSADTGRLINLSPVTDIKAKLVNVENIVSYMMYHPPILSFILDKIKSLFEKNNVKIKRARTTEHEDIDQALLTWFKHQRSNNVAIVVLFCRRKPMILHDSSENKLLIVLRRGYNDLGIVITLSEVKLVVKRLMCQVEQKKSGYHKSGLFYVKVTNWKISSTQTS
ncbi:hypothetical protein KQX54_008534 [Cotesia glomerata]|uniref:Uncharacterized protein n=2 Tax=Cotesia glomerata TaxID=32391 RepID=A0AAV7IZB0_COTGL|nr:hypothetical protein KQX54_008534 [Cotesia glomerata]